MGGMGPKPMAAGLAPPSRGPRAQTGAPSGNAVDVGQLQQSLNSLYGLFTQLETNQKLRSETEQKFEILTSRLAAGGLQPVTLEKISAIVQAVDANNSQAASVAFRELTVKCWNDVKDFSNCLKVLSSFKQRFPQCQQ